MPSSITLALTAAAAALLVGQVHGHAVMTEPTPRTTGDMQEELCGSTLTDALESDNAGPIEDAVEKAAGTDYTCNPYLCRGYQFEDNNNADNILEVTAGDVIYFHIDLIAGHRPGYANTSVIDTATNSIIGDALKSWDAWPGDSHADDRDDINFNVTIPDTLSSSCGEAGKCVIQWYWYATGNEQTYESCVDFYVVV